MVGCLDGMVYGPVLLLRIPVRLLPPVEVVSATTLPVAAAVAGTASSRPASFETASYAASVVSVAESRLSILPVPILSIPIISPICDGMIRYPLPLVARLRPFFFFFFFLLSLRGGN